MALIENSIPKKSSGSYNRIFDNTGLGGLMSQTHSASVRNGKGREKDIVFFANQAGKIVPDLDQWLMDPFCFGRKVFLVTQEQLSESKIIRTKHVPDFLLLDSTLSRKPNPMVLFVETKDGNAFDTKKSDGEMFSLHSLARRIANKAKRKEIYRGIISKAYVCSFFSTDRDEVVEAFKGRFHKNECWTGLDFCSRIGIDYKDIVKLMKPDAELNRLYFADTAMNEFLKLPELTPLIKSKVKHLFNSSLGMELKNDKLVSV